MEASSSLIGIGLYTVPEASRLVRVPAPRLRRWLYGYSYRAGEHRLESPPIWSPQLDTADAALGIGFLDLMEARFVDAFIKHGVSLHTVRLVSSKARELFQKDHPFATRRFRTDGRAIFAEIREDDATRDPRLLDLRRDQFEFHRIVSPSLYAGLDFSDDDSVVRWYPRHPRKTIVVDPGRAFGRPILRREGVPTEILAKAASIEGGAERAAKWYGVATTAAKAAVAFEATLRA